MRLLDFPDGKPVSSKKNPLCSVLGWFGSSCPGHEHFFEYSRNMRLLITGFDSKIMLEYPVSLMR